MKHWEFLLQKEGDRSWLPLDSPDVEILEGRYRVVARSSQKNVEVEIRVSHLATAEDPPKRRIQKRSARISQEGLIVIIPYTRLEPGIWELCCASTDLMSDLIGDAWQYAVKLQVLAKDRETEDWDSPWAASDSEVEPNQQIAPIQSPDLVIASPQSDPVPVADNGSPGSSATPSSEPVSNGNGAADPLPTDLPPDPPPTDLPPEVAEILGASMDRLFQLAEQMSNRLVDEVMQEFDKAAISETASPAQPFTPVAVAPVASLSGPNGIPVGYTLPVGTVAILKLDQEALVARRGKKLDLSGQIELADSSEFFPSAGSEPASPTGSPDEDPWEPAQQSAQGANRELTGATIQEIQLCLRDPQSLQIVVRDRRPIPDQPPPLPFSFSFFLPEDLQTRLVLGEVLLYGTLSDQEEPLSTLLTTQAFTITADPQELVEDLEKINEVLDETLATHTDDEDRIDLPLELSQKLAREQELPSFNLSFLNLEPVEEPKLEKPRRFQSLLGQPLPPQLYQPDPAHPRTKPIELPGFIFPSRPGSTEFNPPASLAKSVPEPPTGADQPDREVNGGMEPSRSETEMLSPEVELTDTGDRDASVPLVETQVVGQVIETIAEPTDESTVLVDKELDKELDSASTPVVAGDADPANGDEVVAPLAPQLEEVEHASVIDLPSPVQMSFQALNLQERFLTRLNSIATDSELSTWLRANLYPGRAVQTAGSSATKKAERLANEEVVVDDDPPSNPYYRRRSGFRRVDRSDHTDEPNPLILPPDEPVPTPVLDITTAGDLVAGKPANIRVRLPYIEPRIYVKLWVIDRQSRSLLDGPRWLLDFLPNSQGELEARTQLTVPFGSLEVLFEAIAIEMHTQRESHKISVDRSVVPPDLPVVSLDDFDTRF